MQNSLRLPICGTISRKALYFANLSNYSVFEMQFYFQIHRVHIVYCKLCLFLFWASFAIFIVMEVCLSGIFDKHSSLLCEWFLKDLCLPLSLLHSSLWNASIILELFIQIIGKILVIVWKVLFIPPLKEVVFPLGCLVMFLLNVIYARIYKEWSCLQRWSQSLF